MVAFATLTAAGSPLTMSDVEIAQLTPAAVPVSKKSSWSRMLVALAAAVSASSAMNSGSCGWTIEADFEGEGWNYIGVTYKDYYKEDFDECTGPCLTDEALTTDELYNVENGEPWSDRAEVALVRGYYDGETFVAA